MAALALAPAEASSTLDLTGTNVTLVMGVAVIAVIALVMGFVFRQQVLRADTGTDKMREIGAAVEEGAQAYLARQFKTLGIFVVLVFGLLLLLPAPDWGVKLGRSGFFVVGAVMAIAALSVAGEFTRGQLLTGLAWLPFIALGYAVAAPLRRHLRTEHLRRAVLAFSALAGASLLLRALVF